MGWATSFAIFFTNSSGHPVSQGRKNSIERFEEALEVEK
jgi:hypothetical protein